MLFNLEIETKFPLVKKRTRYNFLSYMNEFYINFKFFIIFILPCKGKKQRKCVVRQLRLHDQFLVRALVHKI